MLTSYAKKMYASANEISHVCLSLTTSQFDSFYSLIHANNSETLWVESLSPSGETRKWVEQNKQAELSTLIPAEASFFLDPKLATSDSDPPGPRVPKGASSERWT